MKRLFNSQIGAENGSARLAVFALCATSFLLLAGSGDAGAQGREDAPVNLLQLGPANIATDALPTTANNISGDDLGDNLGDDLGDNAQKSDNLTASIPKANLAPAEGSAIKNDAIINNAIINNAIINNDSSDGAAIKAETQAGQTPDAGINTAPTSVARTSTRSDLPATTLGRRTISKISLASVGLKGPASTTSELNALMWSNADAERALYLLRNVPAIGSAPLLNNVVFEIMSIAAVPPKGAGPVAEELISARLNWLAAAGQSDALAEIVRMLPDAERWAEWKRWQVEYDLIRQADDTACRDAERNAQTTLDDFWHQSRIICALLAGDKNKARFAADILKASGGADINFFQLVDKLLGRNTELSLDLATLDSVDLVLMDAAREQISLAAFEQMPLSMIQAASSFRYLAADAALKTSFMMFERGLQGQAPTEQIWRALQEAPMPTEAALATLNGLDAQGYTDAQHDALASASLWVSLALRSEADTDKLIQRAFQTEIRSGRPELMLPLYASLVNQRVGVAQTASQAAEMSPELQKDFALLLSLSALDKPLPAALDSASDFGVGVQNILAAAKGAPWQADSLSLTKSWALLPILTAQKSVGADEDWAGALAQATPLPIKGDSVVYHRLPPRHLMAIQQLAEAGNIAETALLASLLIQPVALGWIDPADAAIVIESLARVGLPQIADQLAEEVVKAHLLRRNFSSAS